MLCRGIGRRIIVRRVKFVNREFLNITYRTDPDALARVIPQHLMLGKAITGFSAFV